MRSKNGPGNSGSAVSTAHAASTTVGPPPAVADPGRSVTPFSHTAAVSGRAKA